MTAQHMAAPHMEFLDDSSDGEVLDTSVKPGTVRIILADSQAIYRVGIRKVFAYEDDLRVVAQADSLENLKLAIERYPTDIVLLEGGLLAGTANVIPDLLRAAPDVKLIVQAVPTDENHTVELYRRASNRGRGAQGERAVLVGEIYLDRIYTLPLRSPAAQGGLPVSAGAERLLSDSGRASRGSALIGHWPACGFRSLPSGACARSSATPNWARGVFAADGRHLPGPRPHLARRGVERFQAQVVEAVGKVGARLRS